MTTPTRLAPARHEVRRPPALLRMQEPPRPAPPRRRGHPPFERVLAISVALSILFHVLVLTLWPPFERGAGPVGAGASAPAEAEAPSRLGMEWIVPVPSDAADASESAAAEPELVPTTPVSAADRAADRASDVPRAIEVRPRAGDAAGADEGAAAESLSESLRPGYRDGRLYVDPRELRTERAPDRHAEYMEHLRARIDALNDSTYGRGPNTDWTHTDSEGRRWGISPEGLHLGGITIPKQLLPLPRSTGRNAEMEAEIERARQRGEIIRQEEDRARDEARERSRREAEERRRRRGAGGSDGGSSGI